MKSTNRREFLATAALASTLPRSIEAAEESIRPIDAHVHVWTPDIERFPLAVGGDQSQMQPASFTPQQLLDECRPHGVQRIVLIQMSFYGFDNRYMLHVMREFPGIFGGVAIVDHDQPRVAETMKELADEGVRGFRLYANAQNASRWRATAGMTEMWRAGADQNLAMCLLADPEALPDIDRMCTKFPKTPVVIDHFARIGMKGAVNQRQLDQLLGLSKYENVNVKTSAFYALGKKQPPYEDLASMIHQLRDSFGAQRLMWASDCPFQLQQPHSYKASIDLIRSRLDFLTDEDRRNMLQTTAERLFFT